MPQSSFDTLIPRPRSVTPAAGSFQLNASAQVWADGPALEVGQSLAELLRPATGFALPVAAASGPAAPGHILLSLDPTCGLGEEGYRLAIAPEGVQIRAAQPAGLFYGAQTLRQLLPPAIESRTRQPGPWLAPAGVIEDSPRFPWRGAMLDVARHFFGVADVKRYLDLLALYKLNRLHLHLTDDQGWRIVINAWPKLAAMGGTSAVGGDPGGYYTQEDYTGLVEYARSRFITIVPEVDMPGHSNAALACYPELNCNGVAPALYTGTEVGFSSFCVDKELTYQFLDDVIGEIARLTPGAYFHIGGDEAASTPKEDFIRFIGRAQEIVRKHGKVMIGWNEVAQVDLLPNSLVQYWVHRLPVKALEQGAKVIMSPGNRTYLDMKYNPATPLGLSWAGYIEVKDAYDWDPARFVEGVGEENLAGVEAPLWSETLRTLRDIEVMVFPRLPGIAEIGWTPQAGRDWEAYSLRLAAHSQRFAALGVEFYASPQVPWPAEAGRA